MRPQITFSVWRPWATAIYDRVSIEEQVKAAQELQADAISIKGVNLKWVYGAEENFSSLSIFKKHSNDAMERAIKAAELDFQMWCWVDCQYPAEQALAMKNAVARWSPTLVKYDNELAKAKQYAFNTGAFLRSQGRLKRHDGSSIPAYLQSYRIPSQHPEIAWEKWATYRDEIGEYYLTGWAPQAYPIGSQDFVGDFGRMLTEYDALERKIGRGQLPWHVTLPTFKESGWAPHPDALRSGIEFLVDRLGERLVGVDFWRLGWLLTSSGKDVREMLVTYDWGESEPQPEPPIPSDVGNVVISYNPMKTKITLNESEDV